MCISGRLPLFLAQLYVKSSELSQPTKSLLSTLNRSSATRVRDCGLLGHFLSSPRRVEIVQNLREDILSERRDSIMSIPIAKIIVWLIIGALAGTLAAAS
jgi:hypothetical protein